MLRVPVTAEERALIEKKMQQMGTRCFSVYARKMLIDGYVIKLDYSYIKANGVAAVFFHPKYCHRVSAPFAHSALLRRIAVCLPGSYGHSAYTQNRYFQCGR